MTSFARNVLSGLPDPNLPGDGEQLLDSTRTSRTTPTRPARRSTCRPPPTWPSSAATASAISRPTISRPSHCRPGAAGNGHIYADNKQFVLGATYTPGARSLLEVRFGWSKTEGGKNPPALGSPSVRSPGSPDRPTGRRRSALANGHGHHHALGRQATNPQWQYPTVWNPKLNYTWLAGRHSLKAGYEFQKIDVEVMDVNPLYGLDTYSNQFTRPAGAASNTLYNLSDFMFGLRSQYAISTLFVAQMRQQMHFGYLQDDIRVNRRLTLNAGPSVRVRHAALGGEQHPDELRPGRPTR